MGAVIILFFNTDLRAKFYAEKSGTYSAGIERAEGYSAGGQISQPYSAGVEVTDAAV